MRSLGGGRGALDVASWSYLPSSCSYVVHPTWSGPTKAILVLLLAMSSLRTSCLLSGFPLRLGVPYPRVFTPVVNSAWT